MCPRFQAGWFPASAASLPSVSTVTVKLRVMTIERFSTDVRQTSHPIAVAERLVGLRHALAPGGLPMSGAKRMTGTLAMTRATGQPHAVIPRGRQVDAELDLQRVGRPVTVIDSEAIRDARHPASRRSDLPRQLLRLRSVERDSG